MRKTHTICAFLLSVSFLFPPPSHVVLPVEDITNKCSWETYI